MFYAIAKRRMSSDEFNFKFIDVIEDIESLNKRALKGELETTALSAHAYLYVQDNYRILPCGASMGKGYGPIVVGKDDLKDLRGKKVGVPGKLTTAFLLLRLYANEFEPVEIPFDKIMNAVGKGKVEAGLLIHEGQLTYRDFGLKKILDLGECWSKDTTLPLPLGINVVRRDFEESVQREISRVLKESIKYALSHKEEALKYALHFGRGMGKDLGERFVLMYVNEYTLDMGQDGRGALEFLYKKALEKGITEEEPRLDVVSSV